MLSAFIGPALDGAGMVSLGAIFQRQLSNGSIIVSVAGRGLEGLAGVAVLGNCWPGLNLAWETFVLHAVQG